MKGANMIRTESTKCTCWNQATLSWTGKCVRHQKFEPCVTEEQNVKPEDCICDKHALEDWLTSGCPRVRMKRAENER